MEGSLIILMILSLFLGAGCWLFFLWGVRKGEFDDLERAKHRMLDDTEGTSPADRHEDPDDGKEQRP
jgi:cbb3-type cytochrome oxidase maturation protein